MRIVYFKTVLVRGILIFLVLGLLSLNALWNKGRLEDWLPSKVAMMQEAVKSSQATINDWEKVSQIESDYWRSVRVETMTARQIVDYLNWSNRTACKSVHYLGGQFVTSTAPRGLDGQYPICLDLAVRPPSGLMSSVEWKDITKKKKGCIVYSFGINDDWSFDDAMAEYGCRVFSFDPSMNRTDHDHSLFVHFYNLGLSDRDQVIDDDGSGGSKWTMKSLDSIYRMLATKRRHDADAVIDYLKIDIEWDEWNVLPQIIQSGMLAKVRQLTVEFHLPTKFISPNGSSSSSNSVTSSSAVGLSLDDYRRLVTVIKSMEQQHGMVRFESRANPWSVKTVKGLDDYVGPTCFEISFYQILPI